MTADEPMTDKDIRLMTSMFQLSWATPMDEKDQRALANVLRGYTWDEADGARAELTLSTVDRPAGVDVAVALEAVRRRGALDSPGKLATKAQRAKGILWARRALAVAQPERASA